MSNISFDKIIDKAFDGFKKITVAPNLDCLDFAEASVPTPSGDITARVERDGKHEVLYLDLPFGVEECRIQWNEGNTKILTKSGKYILRSDE